MRVTGPMRAIAAAAGTLHEQVVADVPKLQRGRVWCHRCGATRDVDAAACLRRGWPRCCGATMSIDSPEERAACRAPAR